LAVFSGERY